MSLASLGAIAGGLNRGIDMAQRDQMLANQQRLQEEQTAAWREDREFQGGQRGRQISEQARADALRDGLAGVESNITAEQQGPLMEGQESLPKIVTGQKSQAKIAGEQADIYKKQGFHEQADKLYRWKDEQEAKAAAQAALTAGGSYTGTDAYDYLTRVKDAVSADQSPVSVDGVEKLDGGRVRVNLKNRITGYSMPMEFSSIQEARDAVTAHYSPDTYNKILERRQAKADKLDEINAKPLELQPGGQAYDRSGKLLAANSNEPAAVQAARIRAGAGGATGAGTGAVTGAGKATDPNKVLNDTLEFIGKNSTLKDSTPDVTARVQQYAFQVVQNSGGKIPPQLAGSIAIDAAMNPSKVQPRIDTVTGSIDMVYDSPEAGEIKFTKGYASARQPANLSKDQLKGFATTLVEKQPPGVRDKFVSAAFDGKARADLERGVRDEIGAMYLKQIQENPQAKDQLIAQRDATIASTMESIGRKLDIVNGHYPKPPAKAGGTTGGSSTLDRLRGAFGMSQPAADPSSPAGKFQARRQASMAEETAKSASRKLESDALAAQFDSDKSAMAPIDFARKYDAMRSRLTRDQAIELRRIEQGI